MRYKVIETADSLLDVQELSLYIAEQFKNYEAAEKFLDQYDEHIKALEIFPLGFRGVNFGYRGHEVRLMPCDSYNEAKDVPHFCKWGCTSITGGSISPASLKG